MFSSYKTLSGFSKTAFKILAGRNNPLLVDQPVGSQAKPASIKDKLRYVTACAVCLPTAHVVRRARQIYNWVSQLRQCSQDVSPLDDFSMLVRSELGGGKAATSAFCTDIEDGSPSLHFGSFKR